jgi:RimJ/RimL family protein N-acetyltransferase
MHRIETKRLVLRSFTADDWRDFQELAVDWKTAPGPTFDKWEISIKACQKSVQRMSTVDNYFAVCLKKPGKIIGLLAINEIDEAKQADLGHVILSKYQDNDHDREALLTIVQHCLNVRGALSIITHNAPEHEAQIAPLRSLGFTNTNPDNPGELTLSKEQWDERDKSQ